MNYDGTHKYNGFKPAYLNFFDCTSNAVLLQGLFAVILIFFTDRL